MVLDIADERIRANFRVTRLRDRGLVGRVVVEFPAGDSELVAHAWRALEHLLGPPPKREAEGGTEEAGR